MCTSYTQLVPYLRYRLFMLWHVFICSNIYVLVIILTLHLTGIALGSALDTVSTLMLAAVYVVIILVAICQIIVYTLVRWTLKVYMRLCSAYPRLATVISRMCAVIFSPPSIALLMTAIHRRYISKDYNSEFVEAIQDVNVD